jgi:hypothetical protein
MTRCKVLAHVFEHGSAYGLQGSEVIVPDHIAKANSDKRRNCALEIIGQVDDAPALVAKTKVAKVKSV